MLKAAVFAAAVSSAAFGLAGAAEASAVVALLDTAVWLWLVR